MNLIFRALHTAIVLVAFLTCLLPVRSRAEDQPPEVAPAGEEKSTKTQLLELGAKALQTDAPLTGMDIYLVGFHPLKEDPAHQMEAHHFCRQVNEDFAQCALFDGNTKDANLNGLEYIISEKLFYTLSAEEKQYWHPHNYEILSGQLIAPGLPEVAEKALMKSKLNSYGKTWHVWNTGSVGHGADKLPVGKPTLAWSFNHDGEAKPGLVERRDEALGVDTTTIRQGRQELGALAKPQEGTDILKGQFSSPAPAAAGGSTQDAPATQPEKNRCSLSEQSLLIT